MWGCLDGGLIELTAVHLMMAPRIDFLLGIHIYIHSIWIHTYVNVVYNFKYIRYFTAKSLEPLNCLVPQGCK